MPALGRPKNLAKIDIPQRKAIIGGDCDVLIVGGGPSGMGAAIGSTRAGARVILAERYAFLGGNATAALVIPLMSWHTQRPRSERPGLASLFPTDHGFGEPVVAGAVSEFVHRLESRGGAIPPTEATGFVVTFDPEIFKIVAYEMLDELGVEFLFHSFAYDVIGDNKVEGVLFATKSGPVAIKSKVVVDCTGDGDIAVAAGAQYEIGRLEDGRVQPMTLMFRMGEFEKEAFRHYTRFHGNQWYGVHGLWDLIKRATMAGELELPREDILFFATPHNKEVSVNSTRVTGLLGTDVWDLTRAEILGRAQMRQVAAFLKKYVPGFEESYMIQSGINIGVRETRRIMGGYKISTHDVLTARKFDDAIARCSYPIDIHNPSGRGTILKRLPRGESYDIPMRCLLPQGIENLLVAGRCISGTHQAHSSYRCMPTSMATGQAAGVCGAIAAKNRTRPHLVPVSEIQDELLRQGANLGKVKMVY